MSLPSVIEIIPLSGPVRAAITVPGSKSITNRALILAALGERETRLEGALWSEDTQVMVEALGVLGIHIKVEPDPLVVEHEQGVRLHRPRLGVRAGDRLRVDLVSEIGPRDLAARNQRVGDGLERRVGERRVGERGLGRQEALGHRQRRQHEAAQAEGGRALQHLTA